MTDGKSGMIKAPVFVLESSKLKSNLLAIKSLSKEHSNVVWLYTLKAFDKQEGLDIIDKEFDGFSVGNLKEYQKIDRYTSITHTYAPVFYPHEVLSLAKNSDTMSFNSISQYDKYAKICSEFTSVGVRINPNLAIKQPPYCDANSSHLGINSDIFLSSIEKFALVDGLHFHIFCHQQVEAFLQLLNYIELTYKDILPKLKWLNFGGGLNFGDKSFEKARFTKAIDDFIKKFPHLRLYLEPASSVLNGCGYLETEVMDIINQDSKTIAILNTSIETQMLDVAITKVKPKVRNTLQIKSAYLYTLAGMSCIAGDIIGDYYFKQELRVGDRVVFEDMIGYTLVKQTSFNGLPLARFVVV